MKSVDDDLPHLSRFWVKNWSITEWFHAKSLNLHDSSEKDIIQFRTEVKRDSVKCKYIITYEGEFSVNVSFADSNGYNSENIHFWHYIGKAKMCLRGVNKYWFFNCLLTIFRIKCHLSNTFWLYHYGVKNACFQSYSH